MEAVITHKVEAVTTSLSAKVQTKLVSGVLLLDPVKVAKRLVPEPTLATRSSRMKSCHLTATDKTEGLLKLPTPEGLIWFYRVLTEGRFSLQLVKVPNNNPLHALFHEIKKTNRHVSLWVGRRGLMLTSVGSPSWELAEYLKGALLEDPGQARVA